MKKLFNKKKIDIPLFLSGGILIIVLALWFFPERLGLLDTSSDISHFRSDLKDLTTLLYVAITFWLVLVTRKMAEISLNAQKASNRPELICELFVSNEKPAKEFFTGIKNFEIRNTEDAEYIDGQPGASIFLIIKNRYGGGKAIQVFIDAEFEAHNPERLSLDRNLEIDYLAEGDSIAFYLYKFQTPSVENCTLKLAKCNLSFTTPFLEASHDAAININYNQSHPILALGNHIGAIKLAHGIRISN